MKIILLIFLVVTLTISVTYAKDLYTSRYDHIDVDNILRSDRLLSNYIKCILDRGRCTPEGAELKRLLPDALKDACEKCTKKQKDSSVKVLKHIVEKRRRDFDQIVEKYDPDRIYKEKYSSWFAKEGINY